MREIKFRRFLKNGIGMQYNFTDDTMWIEDGKIKKTIYSKNYIIMQFTGLKDKNNKEIYEGDIIKKIIRHKYLDEKDWSIYLGIVEMIEGVWRVRNIKTIEVNNIFIPNKILYAFENEVIGNIYKNPELLETKK